MNGSEEVAAHFAANLRRARRRTGLSQEAIGFRASLHRTEVGLLERGARVPRIDTLVKLCAALGVRIDCALLNGITWDAGSTTTTPGEFTFASPGEEMRGLPDVSEEGEAAELVSSPQRPKTDQE